MKNPILLLTLFVFIHSNAQELRKYIPFKYEGKWGIIDSSRVEIAKPKYNSIRIIDDFTYAEFDGKIIYNLTTGDAFPAFGKHQSTIEVDEKKYHLFTNDKKSALINFEQPDTLKLSLKYDYMGVHTFYKHSNGEQPQKSSSLIVAQLSNGKYLLLVNDRDLNPLISNRLESENIEFIKNQQGKKIGFVVQQDNQIVFYDDTLKAIKTIPSNTKESYLIPYEVLKQAPEIYQQEDAKPACFNCASPWNDSWEITNTPPAPGSTNAPKQKYYITNSSLKSNEDEALDISIQLKYFEYPTSYKTIEIHETNSLFFYDSDYMKLDHIMFPEEYLIKQ